MTEGFLRDERKAFWLILGLAAFLFFFRLGDRGLRDPDEGRYAQIAVQMVRGGNWLEPKLFGIDYLRKPPLFYWLVAASFKIFGQNEWAARAVPAFFGLLGVLVSYGFARRFFGPAAAVFSALLLLVNPWYLQVSRYLVIDSVFSFLAVLSLYLYYRAHSGYGRPFLSYAAFYAAVALAFLAKGVLALALPGLAIFVYALWTGQIRCVLRQSRLWAGIPIFLVIAAPWFWWMSRHHPGFWQVFFVREHLSRFVSQNFEHQEGWYFYPALVLAFLSPWVLFPGPWRLLAGRLQENSRQNPAFFLMIFCVTSLALLSLSRSKLATYVLPVIAPSCVLLGAAWADWLSEAPRRRKIFYFFFWLLALGALVVIFAMETVNPIYSTQSFARAVQTKVRPGDRIYVYDHPGPFYDFPFYLDHPVTSVGLEGEFEISREDPGARAASIRREDFLERLKRREHFYCLMRLSDWKVLPEELRKDLKIMAEDDRKILFESGKTASA